MFRTRITAIPRKRTAAIAASLAIAGALVPLGIASAQAAPAHAASPKFSTAAKPTTVLVHGAWADASSWTASPPSCCAMATPSTSRPTRCAG